MGNIYYQNKSYKKFVSALTLFQSIINGRFFVDILRENGVYQQILLHLIANLQCKYANENESTASSVKHSVDSADTHSNVVILSESQSVRGAAYKHDIPEYIQELFEYFYLNQHYV